MIDPSLCLSLLAVGLGFVAIKDARDANITADDLRTANSNHSKLSEDVLNHKGFQDSFNKVTSSSLFLLEQRISKLEQAALPATKTPKAKKRPRRNGGGHAHKK